MMTINKSWNVPEDRRVQTPNYSPGRGRHPVPVPDVLCVHYAVDRVQKVDLPGACDEQARLWGPADRAEDCMDVARYFARRGARASAHYVVGRDGSVAQCVSLQDTAWHAGGGSFPLNGFGPLEKPVTGRFNRRSIGIEMCNVGWATERFGIPEEGTLDATHPATPSRVQTWERYTAVQIEALATVVQWAVWSCPGLRWVVGHEDVVNRDTLGRVGGKTDPGPAFPWGDVPWSSFGLTRVRYDYLEKAWVTDED